MARLLSRIIMKSLENFVRKKDILICVDSDGCAMDTMDIKHRECFGPKMVECYGLSECRKEALAVWNEINLYSLTRGVNRFIALATALRTLEERKIARIPVSYGALEAWTREARELSNPALSELVKKSGDTALALALRWSVEVNAAIASLPEENGAFHGVRESLRALSDIADIAVVSSANGGALESEWHRCGLDGYIGALLGQEAGNKAFCISELVRLGGYDKERVLMVGDAPGDLKAAEKNGVLYYPILVGKEEYSWRRLREEAVAKLADGSFFGEYQEKVKKEFFENLT